MNYSHKILKCCYCNNEFITNIKSKVNVCWNSNCRTKMYFMINYMNNVV